mmetsp:Transcript_78486/g.233857  ORF Transcript_78486/g.233857 Transcript_78486/m.233857 type:complete len:242 (-) Transcript_78486:59-784(-)
MPAVPFPTDDVAVSATRPSFQMPLEWSVATALGLARLADAGAPRVAATVAGYSTPSVVDVGGSSLRLSFGLPEVPAADLLATSGSIALCLRRRGGGGAWLPGVAGVPGHHADRAGQPRHGLLEAVVMARPTVKGGLTFLQEDVLREWAPEGTELELVPLQRLDDFHVDDGSGPWLRDRICITASQAEDFVAPRVRACGLDTKDIDLLLRGSGLRREASVQPPPADEWDLARLGQLHRDCAL